MRLLIFFLLSLLSFSAAAQQASSDKSELIDLLKKRQEKFSSYTSSLDKRSGIFGNKTKKDMQRSNEVLVEIVRTDNKIIDVLNRIIDYRNFEKTTMTYDIHDYDKKFNQLQNSVNVLVKQKDQMLAENANLQRSVSGFKWLMWIFLSAFAVMYYSYRRLKQKSA